MKFLFAAAFLLASVFFTGNRLADKKAIFSTRTPANCNFFLCRINGVEWLAKSAVNTGLFSDNTKNLSVAFTYDSRSCRPPSGFFIQAKQGKEKQQTGFYIQPVSDDEPAAFLHAGNDIYKDIYITYKTADGKFFNSHNSPGNFQITAIDSIHKTIQGKFNCVLLNSTGKKCLLITDGQFCFHFNKL